MKKKKKHVYLDKQEITLIERFHFFFYHKQLFDGTRSSVYYYFSPTVMYVFKSNIETLD